MLDGRRGQGDDLDGPALLIPQFPTQWNELKHMLMPVKGLENIIYNNEGGSQ